VRAGPSTLVRSEGTTLLVDCGRGVLLRLAAVCVLPPMRTAVLVTHLHSDHLTDLTDVITTQWIMSPSPMPLRIYGPPLTAEVVQSTLAAGTICPPKPAGRHDVSTVEIGSVHSTKFAPTAWFAEPPHCGHVTSQSIDEA